MFRYINKIKVSALDDFGAKVKSLFVKNEEPVEDEGIVIDVEESELTPAEDETIEEVVEAEIEPETAQE